MDDWIAIYFGEIIFGIYCLYFVAIQRGQAAHVDQRHVTCQKMRRSYWLNTTTSSTQFTGIAICESRDNVFHHFTSYDLSIVPLISEWNNLIWKGNPWVCIMGLKVPGINNEYLKFIKMSRQKR